MASPLSTLRKYQYGFFVFFGVVCMLVFVVGDPLDSWMRSRSGNSGRGENKVVVRWDGGQFRESELDYARTVRRVISEFMQNLFTETQKKNGSPRVQGLSLSPSEQDIVYTQVFAERARRIGMVVSDEAALVYLENFTANLIPRNGIGQIFRETVGNRITEQQLLAEIKTALLAQNYLNIVVPESTSGQLPARAWEYHLRLNRRVKAEVLPVKVADFKSKVEKEPTESEIAALYAEGKDRYPDPASPLPGFKRHRKAAFDFVRADRKKLEDEETAKVKSQTTNQEIQEYYDKNKEQFRVREVPATAPNPPATDPTKSTTPPASESPEKKEEAQPAESSKSDETKKAEPIPEKSEVKTQEKPADEKKSENKESTEEKKAPASEPPATTEKKDEPAPNQQEGANSPCGVAQEEKTEEKAEEKVDEKPEPAAQNPAPAEKSAPAEPPAAAPAASTDEKKSADAESKKDDSKSPTASEKKEEAKDASPAPAPPATPTTPPAAPDASATPGTQPPAAANPAATTAPPTRPEPQYQVLDDKLKEDIRERVARQKASQAAQQRIDKAFEEIRRAVEKYAREKRTAELTKKAAPAAVDLASLAAKHGMTSGATPLSDPNKIQETELGRTRGFDFSSMSFEPIPFHLLAYREGVPLYSPDQIRGSASDGNPDIEFLFWKTKEEEPYVPALADARAEVVDAWKLKAAFSLAEAEAKRLAEEAKQSNKPIKETFAGKPDLKVAETNEFTWMSRGVLPANMGGSPALSAVDNVENPGPDFMKSVFALKPGEVGLATNHPKSIVYVVRVEKQAPSDDLLKEQFLQAGNTVDLQQIAFGDRAGSRDGWFDSIKEEMKVKWERDPQS